VKVEAPSQTHRLRRIGLRLLGDPVAVTERRAANRREREEEADEGCEKPTQRRREPAQIGPPELVHVDPRPAGTLRHEPLDGLDAVRDLVPLGMLLGRLEVGPECEAVRDALGRIAAWVVADPCDYDHGYTGVRGRASVGRLDHAGILDDRRPLSRSVLS